MKKNHIIVLLLNVSFLFAQKASFWSSKRQRRTLTGSKHRRKGTQNGLLQTWMDHTRLKLKTELH
jgi:hypothetical protein